MIIGIQDSQGGVPHDLFDQCVASIDTTYARLGHALGWRFLTTPRSMLCDATEFGFISLNPGGSREPPEHPRASSESGSSYLTESWHDNPAGSAPLQRQVQALFAALARHTGHHEPLADFANQSILSAHYIPFRSPRLADLPRRQESLAFAQELWGDILRHWRPRILITIDREAYTGLSQVFCKQAGARQFDAKRFNTGWGNYQADVVRFSSSSSVHALTLARLPHLSTFKLFSRPACRPHIEDFMAYVTASRQLTAC